MALTRSQKEDVINQIGTLLNESKMTVVAKYQGIDVKSLQKLRRDAKSNGTAVKIVKNRLVRQAASNNAALKDTDLTALEGMLLYAFNSEDEVAAAQALHNFAKANPNLEFVGAISETGEFLDSDKVKALALLPGKNQLIAEVIGLLNSPIRGIVGSLSGNLSSILGGLEAKASN